LIFQSGINVALMKKQLYNIFLLVLF